MEIIDRISFLAAGPAVVGLLVALGMIMLVRRWQIHILGMTILYFFVALLHTQVIRPEVALVKALMGWLICLTLFVTGRYIDQQRREREREGEPAQVHRQGQLPAIPAETPLRGVILVATFVIAYVGSTILHLPVVSENVELACYLLGVGGVLLAGMAEAPLPVGLGLLIFLAGFDLFFGALEPSLAVAGLLGASGFLIALAVTFLAVTGAAFEEKQP